MSFMSSIRSGFGSLFGGGFEAVQSTRRLRAFEASRSHINALIRAAGPTLIARARFLCRNNGYAINAVDSWAGNAVGDGIKPLSTIDVSTARAKKRKVAIQEAWLAWTDEADADGVTDFYGLQRRVAREFFIAGECFVRFRPRRPQDGLTVPLQLQVLSAEMLPLNLNRPLKGGGEIRCGIEFDEIGRRVAYHFLKRHPGDVMWNGSDADTTRVAASDVMHIFDPVDAGQIRGVSRFSAAVIKLFLLDQYDDAELDRKKVAALYAVFIISPDAEEDEPEEDGDDIQLQPGTIAKLAPGEDIKTSDPADSGTTYEPFQFRTLLQISAALGVPYSYVTNDTTRGNFANSRLTLQEFRRRVSAWQHGVLVFQLCRPVWARWMDMAVMSGALTLPNYERDRASLSRCKWLPPRWEWVDPAKDAAAEITQIAAGLKSRSQAISERGYDAEEVDAERAADRDRERRLDLASEPASAAENRQVPDEDENDGADPRREED